MNEQPRRWYLEDLEMSPEPEPSHTISTRAKVIAGLTSAAAIAGAVVWANSGEASSNNPTAAPVSPTETSVSRALAAYGFEHTITSGQGLTAQTLADTAASIPKIAGTNKDTAQAFHAALDAATAKTILGYSPYSNPDDRLSVSTITDTGLRTETAVTTYTLSIADTIRALNPDIEDHNLSKVEQSIAQAPAGAEQQKSDALVAAQIEYAKQILSDYSDFDDAEQKNKFDTRAKEITDPGVQQQLQATLRKKQAANILLNAAANSISTDEARAKIAALGDPELQTRALAALNKTDSSDYSTDAYAVRVNLDSEVLKFGGDQTTFETTDVKQADALKSELSSQVYDKANAAQAAFSKDLASEAHLQPQIAPVEQPKDPQPGQLLDLSQITSTVEVPNQSEAEQSSVDASGNPKTFAQFGEVYVKNGEMQIVFDGEVSAALKAQFTAALRRNEGFLSAAFASGNLLSVRLVLSDSFNPYYDGSSREMIMNLSKDDPPSEDQLESAVTHESTHALLGDYFNGIQVTPEEQHNLAEACYNLQLTTYKNVQGILALHVDDFNDMRAHAKPEHKAIVDTLSNAILHGSIQDLLTNYSDIEGTQLNSCYYSGNFQGLIDAAVNKTKTAKDVSYTDLDYLADTPGYKAIEEAASLDLQYGSVFAKLINESNYVQTPSPVRRLLGHSRDNANELFASLMDVMRNYGDKFKVGLDSLAPDMRSIMQRFIFIEGSALKQRHPSLAPMIDTMLQTYAAMK